MSNVNVPLLRKAVEWAEAEDKLKDGGSWDQGSWWRMPASMWRNARKEGQVKTITNPQTRGYEAGWAVAEGLDAVDVLESEYITCKSAGCVAGYVAAIHGDRAAAFRGDEVGPRGGVDGELVGDYVMDENNVVIDVKARATELLGIGHEQANRLFAPGNDIKDVRRIAESIAGGPL